MKFIVRTVLCTTVTVNLRTLDFPTFFLTWEIQTNCCVYLTLTTTTAAYTEFQFTSVQHMDLNEFVSCQLLFTAES